MAKNKEVAVIVCTDKRGVFFGYIDVTPEAVMSAKSATLRRARMCVQWSVATKGVLGLASDGPAKGSRVTDEIPAILLDGIHAVLIPTDAAITRWSDPPWA